ncbi:MAG: S-layer homology domain-containing protein [Clostridia bacterium]|nr:S-layer homology domain-containing protein [Clostridia bacterium]
MKRFGFCKRALTLALCGAVGFGAFGLVGCARGSNSTAVLSYGMSVLAAETDVAVSGYLGNEVGFTVEDFARGLNLSSVDSITIRSLPADTEGELLLGSSRVAVGQTISAENVVALCFVPADETVAHASFGFTANASTSPVVCNVYLLAKENYTPTLSTAPDLSLNVSTYKELSTYGTLWAYDPDGDAVVFEVVKYPQNGAIRLTDRAAGTYVYTPEKDFTGKDSFSYVARDIYGNYSAARTVNLEVSTAGTSVTYADMEDSPASVAALTLTEAGIMSGRQVGNRYYFEPAKSVSRVEFLVMAMHAAGITEVPSSTDTGFADDGEIPASMKGYVAAAYELGYISGTNVQGETCFLPHEEITRAQAAVILDRIVGKNSVEVIPTFGDSSEIPVWATQAIYSLHSVGILLPTGGYIDATDPVTREDTAQMLAAVMAYMK